MELLSKDFDKDMVWVWSFFQRTFIRTCSGSVDLLFNVLRRRTGSRGLELLFKEVFQDLNKDLI